MIWQYHAKKFCCNLRLGNLAVNFLDLIRMSVHLSMDWIKARACFILFHDWMIVSGIIRRRDKFDCFHNQLHTEMRLLVFLIFVGMHVAGNSYKRTFSCIAGNISGSFAKCFTINVVYRLLIFTLIVIISFSSNVEVYNVWFLLCDNLRLLG